ncbi:MAG: signal recognition particle receptor subunit alpha, partial [Calditrichaeota bacterium]|nr:signal recognition particle receptor subunit alpha [Calditrichota bacterium]
MLEDLSSKLESVLKKVRGQGKLTEKNIADSLKEIRRALLEADVNYKVVKNFITEVQEKALGEEVLRSITPGQQIVKIVYDELVQLMGESHTDMKTAGIPPTIVMICGLQGSGKTTFTGKLGNFLRKKGRRPMLVGADVYRPAAKKQLEMLGESIGIPVYTSPSNDALEICRASIKAAR